MCEEGSCSVRSCAFARVSEVQAELSSFTKYVMVVGFQFEVHICTVMLFLFLLL